jgi:hypothetical protein
MGLVAMYDHRIEELFFNRLLKKGNMKMTETISKDHNQKTFNDFVAIIRENVEASTKNWYAIAEAFAEAREIFGANPSIAHSGSALRFSDCVQPNYVPSRGRHQR